MDFNLKIIKHTYPWGFSLIFGFYIQYHCVYLLLSDIKADNLSVLLSISTLKIYMQLVPLSCIPKQKR